MEILPQRRIGVLFVLVVIAICALPFLCLGKAQILPQTNLLSPDLIQDSGTIPSLHLAQADKKIRVAVFTFNILNLGAAGHDATISNLFMTLLDQHRIFEVMSRKQLELSLRRAGLQQSEDLAVVQ